MFESIKYMLFVSVVTFSFLWITRRYWDSFCVRKKRSLSSVLPWILLCVSQLFSLYLRQDTALWPTLFNSLSLLLVGFFSYESTCWETFLLFTLHYAMWAATEFSLYSLIYLLKMDYQSTRSLGTLMAHILMLLFTHIVSLLATKKEKAPIPHRISFSLLLLPVGSIYIMFVQHFIWGNHFLSIGVFIVLLLFNILIFDAYTKLSQYFLREKENAIHEEQLSMISQNMEEQKKLMDEFYEEKHNLINELTALRGSIQRESSEKILRNLDQILNSQHVTGSVSSSGNSTVDAIINAKYATAKEYGISFHLNICLPKELTIAPSDLGVLIGNALDNAVTAVKECTSAERSIQISMGIKKNSLIMVMKNPYEHTIIKNRNGEFLSTKSEKRAHGYGIRSILRVANAYNGDVVIDTDHGLFVLTAILNLDEF